MSDTKSYDKEIPSAEVVDSEKNRMYEADADDDKEVFKKIEGAIDYRTVGWVKAAFLMLKVIFSLGVLSIPSVFTVLGAVAGGILVVFWTSLNTYCAFILGNFRNRHGGIHTVADMGGIMWGPIGKELVGGMYLFAYVLVAGSSLLGLSIALNAVSDHAICTVGFTAVSMVATVLLSCLPKFEYIGWLTWVGCASIIIAVFIVVVAVTVPDRPAMAPKTGDFDLGFIAFAHPTFANAMAASDTLFVSSAGTSSFITVMAEMKNPRDFKKSVMLGMSFTTVAYIVFPMIIFKYCGQWIASPALGSAGNVIKKVSYGIAIPGLWATAILTTHLASKYLFVRLLRNSRHLQDKTSVHWGTWLGCNIGLAAIAFVIAEGVPFFNQLLGLTGAICFAPLALCLPACLWLYDNGKINYRSSNFVDKITLFLHCFLFLMGTFVTVAGTYSSIKGIIDAYDAGLVGGAFTCSG